jgi:hypothetical protein
MTEKKKELPSSLVPPTNTKNNKGSPKSLNLLGTPTYDKIFPSTEGWPSGSRRLS